MSQRGHPDTASLTESIDDEGYNYDGDDQTLDANAKTYYGSDRESEEAQPDVEYEVTADPKTDSRDTENDGHKAVAGSVDATSLMTAPKFKNLDKMYKLQVKPAGNYVKLKCPVDGKKLNIINNLSAANVQISHEGIRQFYD